MQTQVTKRFKNELLAADKAGSWQQEVGKETLILPGAAGAIGIGYNVVC
jgi:hypothetical protein